MFLYLWLSFEHFYTAALHPHLHFVDILPYFSSGGGGGGYDGYRPSYDDGYGRGGRCFRYVWYLRLHHILSNTCGSDWLKICFETTISNLLFL